MTILQSYVCNCCGRTTDDRYEFQNWYRLYNELDGGEGGHMCNYCIDAMRQKQLKIVTYRIEDGMQLINGIPNGFLTPPLNA